MRARSWLLVIVLILALAGVAAWISASTADTSLSLPTSTGTTLPEGQR